MHKPILDEAREIVIDRASKTHNYGSFTEGMKRAAMIYNGMTGDDVTAVEMYKALIALKLSRESYVHKRDNLVDACGYMQGLEDFYNDVDRG